MALTMLRDPSYEHYRIIDIAFACGFRNLVTFNRVFPKYLWRNTIGIQARFLTDQRIACDGRSCPSAVRQSQG